MKLHHLNCGCMNPIGGKLLPSVFPRQVVCHCVLVETSSHLMLVDCGLARRDVRTRRLGAMATLLGVHGDPNNNAYDAIARLGFSPSDVTDLIPTHLDFDHAGGIEDFPQANVHVAAREYQACQTSGDVRYKTIRFSHDVRWKFYETNSNWRDFECARDVLPEGLVAVSLPGHTEGHMGILIQDDLLHAGDAYYDHRELIGQPHFGLSMFQRVIHSNYRVALETQRRLVNLQGVRVFSAHDPVELSQFVAP